MPSYRADFPIFATHSHLIYLDSAASAQKPAAVIEAVSEFYRTSYANVHRGLYSLSTDATEQYEAARQTVADFISASSSKEIIFTRGATEALNLLASSLSQTWEPGDEVIISQLEHHANYLPWLALQQRGIVVKIAKITEAGEIDLADVRSLISAKTRAISLSHCSNVFGRVTPLVAVKKMLREEGSEAFLIVDAAQSLPHCPVSVHELGADFLVFSSHKVYGPSGVGVLWGRSELLKTLAPYQTGGEMVKTIRNQTPLWNDIPWKFEAGTPNVEGAIGLAAALRYLTTIGMEQVKTHTRELAVQARLGLEKLPQAHILGDPSPESGIISFTIDGVHPHDLAAYLDSDGICIRAGHHCAAPLHEALDLTASNRISIGLYNTAEDIERCLSAIQSVIQTFHA